MHFTWLAPARKTPAPRPLTARIKAHDGSVVLAHIADVFLGFNTVFGHTRIPLSRIRRLRHIVHSLALQDISRLNRFQIHCVDGNEFIGCPASPDHIQVAVIGPERAWNAVRLVEIDWLEILGKDSAPHAGDFAINGTPAK